MYDDGPLSTRQQLDALKLERERAKLLADQAKAQQQVNKVALDARQSFAKQDPRRVDVPPVQSGVPVPQTRSLTDTQVIQRESSNDPLAKNKDSSAFGLYQMTDAAREDAIVVNPKLAGMDYKDPAVQEQYRDAYKESIRRQLISKGVAPDSIDDNMINQAWVVGPTGYDNVRRSQPNAPLGYSLSKSAIDTNPNLQNKTALDYLSSTDPYSRVDTKVNEKVPVSGPSVSMPMEEIPRLGTDQSIYDALKQLNLPLPGQASNEKLIPDPLAVNNGQTVDQALSQLRLIAHDGGPAIINPDGTTSTEVSITVTDPSLNNGAPTNIPSLWNGKIVDENTAIANALKAGADKYKSYNSVEEAVAAAKERSDNGGAYAGSQVPPPVTDPGLHAEVPNGQIDVDSKEVDAGITSAVKKLSPEDQNRFSLLGQASRANLPLIKSLQESLKDINKPVQEKEDLPTTFWEGLSKGFGEMFTSAEFIRFGLLLAGGLISGGSIGGSLKYAGIYAMQSAEKRLASEKAAKAKAQQAEQERKEKIYDATVSQIRTLEGEDRAEVRAVDAENRALIRKFGEEQRALQRELNKEDRGFNEYLKKKEIELNLTLNAEKRSQLREEYTNLRERDESISTLLTNALASTKIDPRIREEAYNQFVKNSRQPDLALRVLMQDDLAKRLNLETREKEPGLKPDIRIISGVPQAVRVDKDGNVFREMQKPDGTFGLVRVPYAMTTDDYARLTGVGKKAITDTITPLIAGNNVKVNSTQIAGALAEKTISVVQAMEVFNSNIQPRDLSNMSASAMRAIGQYDPSEENEAQYIDKYHSALYTSSVVELKPGYKKYFTDKVGNPMSSDANNLIRQELAGGNLDQKVEKLVKDYGKWVAKPNNKERLTAALARREGESPLSAYLRLIR
jgi:hypothetical protein